MVMVPGSLAMIVESEAPLPGIDQYT